MGKPRKNRPQSNYENLDDNHLLTSKEAALFLGYGSRGALQARYQAGDIKPAKIIESSNTSIPRRYLWRVGDLRQLAINIRHDTGRSPQLGATLPSVNVIKENKGESLSMIRTVESALLQSLNLPADATIRQAQHILRLRLLSLIEDKDFGIAAGIVQDLQSPDYKCRHSAYAMLLRAVLPSLKSSEVITRPDEGTERRQIDALEMAKEINAHLEHMRKTQPMIGSNGEIVEAEVEITT